MQTTTPKTSEPIRMSEEDWRLEKISQGLAEASREEFADDAEIEAEMRGIIADARAKRGAHGGRGAARVP